MYPKPTSMNSSEIRIFSKLSNSESVDRKREQISGTDKPHCIKKEIKCAVNLSADPKVAAAKTDCTFIATAGIAHRAVIIFGLLVNSGEPQCICNGIRTTSAGLKH